MKSTINFIALAFIALLTAHSVSAQEFAKGTNVINAGIGLGGNFYYGSFTSPSQGLGVNASYERGIWETGDFGIVSLGGYLGYKPYKSESWNGTKFNLNYTIIGVRGAFHYIKLDVENLDVYGGAMVSYNLVSASLDDDAISNLDSRPSATVFVGGRWYFGDHFGVFAEAGYGVSILSLGAAFRF